MKKPSPSPKFSKASIYAAILASVKSRHRWMRGENGQLYYYSEGRYVPERGMLARSVTSLMAAYRAEPIHEDEYYNKVLNHLLRNSEELPPAQEGNKISVKNGLLNLETLQLEAHTEDWKSMVRLDTEWRPEAKGEEWRKFLTTVFPSDGYIDFVAEVIGACLTADRSVQSAIWLKGTGSNGKSTLMKAVEEMIGRENTVPFSLHDIDRNPFITAEFYGKLLGIDYDTKEFNLENSQTIKKLISGDPILAQRKFAQPFQFTPTVKIVTCGNSLPMSKDLSFGFTRRFVIVPMLKKFTPEKQGFENQGTILRRLSQEDERGWMLFQAAKGWKRLRERGDWTIRPEAKKATEEFRMKHHPFQKWARENLIEGRGTVREEELLERVNEWMRRKGYEEVEKGELERLMETTGRRVEKGWERVSLL